MDYRAIAADQCEALRGIEYPSRKKFTTRFFYQGGKIIGQKVGSAEPTMAAGFSKSDLKYAVSDENVDETAFGEAMAIYRDQTESHRAKFREALAAYCEIPVGVLNVVRGLDNDYERTNMEAFDAVSDFMEHFRIVQDALKAGIQA